MSEDSEIFCILCPIYRPKNDPRQPHVKPVCNPCRDRFRREIREVADLAALLPHALEPSGTSGERVSGTSEPGAAVRVGLLDYVGPIAPKESVTSPLIPKVETRREVTGVDVGGEVIEVAEWRREIVTDHDGNPVLVPEGDQVGVVPVAAKLDSWVRDWHTYNPSEKLPVPTVSTLVAWMMQRSQWACTHHPAVDACAQEVYEILSGLRAGLLLRRRVFRLPGEPCPSCGVAAITREAGASHAECGNCGRTWKEDEFDRLVVILASEAEDQEAS